MMSGFGSRHSNSPLGSIELYRQIRAGLSAVAAPLFLANHPATSEGTKTDASAPGKAHATVLPRESGGVTETAKIVVITAAPVEITWAGVDNKEVRCLRRTAAIIDDDGAAL